MIKQDVLNAILTDLVADQVRRARDLGYKLKEVQDAVVNGLTHGVAEYDQLRRERNAANGSKP